MTYDSSLLVPPHSVEAEQSVIGAILLAGADSLDRIEGVIGAEDFYRQEHREIFAAIRRMGNAGCPIDVITVAEALEGAGSLERVGGLPYLGTLAQNVPSTANIKRYAEIVRERAQQRKLLALAEEIRASCYASGVSAADIISQTDAAMVQLIGSSTDEPVSLYDSMTDAIADIDARATGKRRSGLQTGIAGIDELTCGLEPGQLVILAARPSIGKTALALNIADYVARQGGAVAFFSLEMTKRELTQRLIALRTGIPVAEQRTGNLPEKRWDCITACHAGADGQRLFLIDRSSIGVPYVRAVGRKIQRSHGLAMIAVDYLQLMKGEGQNRTQEIGSLSRGLKALAKELQVPIIALAQLNRATEGRADRRPQLADLRDSGEIEQDADIVAMLHREEMYSTDPQWKGYAQLLIRKNRNGATGEISLRYLGEQMRFERYEGPLPGPNKAPSRSAGFD